MVQSCRLYPCSILVLGKDQESRLQWLSQGRISDYLLHRMVALSTLQGVYNTELHTGGGREHKVNIFNDEFERASMLQQRRPSEGLTLCVCVVYKTAEALKSLRDTTKTLFLCQKGRNCINQLDLFILYLSPSSAKFLKCNQAHVHLTRDLPFCTLDLNESTP